MFNIQIWDIDNPKPHKNETNFFLRKSDIKKNKRNISIPVYIQKNSKSLREEYLKWIYELGLTKIKNKTVIEFLKLKNNFSYWWMSSINEKSNYLEESPQIETAIKVIALNKHIDKKKINQISLFTDNKILLKFYKSFSKKNNIKLKYKLYKKEYQTFNIKSLYEYFPLFIQAFLWLFYYLIKRWNFRKLKTSNWNNTQAKITFVSYLPYIKDKSVLDKKFKSIYWGNLSNNLEKQNISTNWLHILTPTTSTRKSKNTLRHLRNLNNSKSNNQNHITLDSFINFKLIFQIIYDWFFIAIKSKKVLKKISHVKSNNLNLFPFIEDDFKNSFFGKKLMSNVYFLNLIKTSLQSINKQKIGFYLQENIDWEFSLSWAWKRYGHGKLIGYPHSTIRFWDLRYFFYNDIFSLKGINSIPMPDNIVVNGELNKMQLIDGGYSKDMLIELEATRYNYLVDLKKQILKKSNLKLNNKLNILVILGYNEKILTGWFDLILNLNYSIIFKPHPISSDQSLIDKYKNKLKISSKPLKELFLISDYVLCGSTSASTESMFLGINTFIFSYPKKLNASPLLGLKNMNFINSDEDLTKALTTSLNKKTNHFKNIFYLDENNKRWSQLINNNL